MHLCASALLLPFLLLLENGPSHAKIALHCQMMGKRTDEQKWWHRRRKALPDDQGRNLPPLLPLSHAGLSP